MAAAASGLVSMWWFLDAGPLVLDEHGSYWIVGRDNPGTLLERSLNVAATPPLSFWLQRAACDLLGESELALRLPAAICFLLAIAVTFLLGKELLGPLGGGLTALVLAWHPGVVDEVRIGRQYGTTVLFAALAFWLTVRWKKHPQDKWTGVAWVAANVALLWTHYVTLPAIALAVVVLVLLPGPDPDHPRPPARHLLLAGLALVLATFPLWPSILRIWEWSPFLNYSTSQQSLWHVMGSLWWAGLPAGWLIAFAGSRGWRSQPQPPHALASLGWLAVWSVLPVLGMALVSRGDWTSLANPRYQIAFTIPAACFIAGCISYRTKPVAACLGTVVAIAAAWFANDAAPWELRRVPPTRAETWKLMALTVEEEGQPDEPLFVQSGLAESSLVPVLFRDELFMDYVACRLGRFYLKTPHPRYGLPFFWEGDDQRRFFTEILDEVCDREEPTVWVAAAIDTDLNRQSLAGMRALLAEQGYVADLTREFPTAVLVRYRCRRPK